jgi:hypothetical protein
MIKHLIHVGFSDSWLVQMYVARIIVVRLHEEVKSYRDRIDNVRDLQESSIFYLLSLSLSLDDVYVSISFFYSLLCCVSTCCIYYACSSSFSFDVFSFVISKLQCNVFSWYLGTHRHPASILQDVTSFAYSAHNSANLNNAQPPLPLENTQGQNYASTITGIFTLAE